MVGTKNKILTKLTIFSLSIIHILICRRQKIYSKNVGGTYDLIFLFMSHIKGEANNKGRGVKRMTSGKGDTEKEKGTLRKNIRYV